MEASFPKRKPKHPNREAFIRSLAGTVPAEDIAKRLGLTRKGLSAICSKLKISLRVPGLQAQRMREWHEARGKLLGDKRVKNPRAIPKPMKIDVAQLWRPTSLTINS